MSRRTHAHEGSAEGWGGGGGGRREREERNGGGERDRERASRVITVRTHCAVD